MSKARTLNEGAAVRQPSRVEPRERPPVPGLVPGRGFKFLKGVVAVVNFSPRRVAGFPSEVLVLGVSEGDVVLRQPDQEVPHGVRVF